MSAGLGGLPPLLHDSPAPGTYTASFSRRFSLLSSPPLNSQRRLEMESKDRNVTDETVARSSVNRRTSESGDHDKAIHYEDCTGAAYRIRKGINKTPLQASPQLSSITGIKIFFKKEFTLPTGSFKERGARNSLELLPVAQRKIGVIAASAGNHALALAYHGKLLKIPVTVVMPTTAPIMKVTQCEMYGATVILHGKDLGEAKKFATSLAKTEGLQYINGYNHPHILAGQGTIALEIIEQMDALTSDSHLDAIVVPIGGGGLIAGISVVMKHLLPNVEVVGVESEQCSSFSKSLEAGYPVQVTPMPTLADGLAVPKVGPSAFATAKGNVDRTLLVSEDDIALAILRLVEIEKAVVEGAGATGLAACLSGKLNDLRGKNVVVLLSGGNIDTTVLGRCLDRGLAADGRLVRLTVLVNDRPGGLKGLIEFLYEQGVSVKDIIHERTWLKGSIFNVEIECVVETRGRQHAESLRAAAMKKYDKDFIKWGRTIDEPQDPCSTDPSATNGTESSYNGLNTSP